MRKSLLLATLFALGAVGLLQSYSVPQGGTPSAGKVGASAVWQMSPSFLSSARATCDTAGGSPSSYADCFINQMRKAGASADAVAFARSLHQTSGGDVGIMTGFNKVGPVDVGWITYPLRANTNYGLLFLNGTPGIVNAEDLKLLDRAGMQQSGQYQDLQGQFPKVGLWPGDRDGTTWPNSQSGPNNGIQFVLSYPLRNGCQACAHAGFALFTWNFDAGGKFLGTTFIGLTPPPLKQ